MKIINIILPEWKIWRIGSLPEIRPSIVRTLLGGDVTIPDAARSRFAKQTGVRWSELLRLPYFDPIRFLTVDPMHCLFLGIAKWIVKKIWVDEGVLTPDNLKNIQRKMNQIQVPADLGRIPRKIDRGEGFINFTADQWRTFFTIYATTSLWEYLSTIDRTILTHFVRVCSVLVGRILTFDLIEEAAERLIKIIKLITVVIRSHQISIFRSIYKNVRTISALYT